jgi:hypothetical protein
MIFKWITGSELERLTPVFEKFGWTPLDPVFSKALIAEDEEGEIVGFNVLQVCLRPEPLYVAPAYRGENGIAMELAAQMAKHLKDSGAVYWEVKARTPFVEAICTANGMEKETLPIYKGGVVVLQ